MVLSSVACRRFAEEVLAFEPGLRELSDEELAKQTAKFRQRLADGEPLKSLQSEAFATVTLQHTSSQHHIANSHSNTIDAIGCGTSSTRCSGIIETYLPSTALHFHQVDCDSLACRAGA